jgi:aspartyl-tRNA(Asn)/glutamyl-tRNA(Gln) amidotransferase subunit A
LKQYCTLYEIQSDLAQGGVTCVSLVSHFLQQINNKQHLNAFLEVYTEEALERARQIDAKLATGTAGKLHGLVIGLKDVISYQGHVVSASSKMLESFKAIYNATVTQRLLDADAIIIGRLNCDEFAMGGSNENSAYGNVLNALDNTKVPGGSSGGSAVAVQAGMCHAALGTDTGGSIRQPASFTGIFGMKPTYGLVSRWGVVAYASSFDQLGPMTNSVEDAALILETIAGPDDHDSTLAQTKVPHYSQLIGEQTKRKIAYYPEVLEHEGLDETIKQQIEVLIADLRSDGHTVEVVSFPFLDYLVPSYYVLTTAEASSNLSRYDGVHYGYRSPEAKGMDEVYTLSRTQSFGTEVKRRIMLGTFVLSAGYYDAYYGKAQKARRLIQDATLEVLNNYDFIILPTTPTTAFNIGEKTTDPIAMYLADIFTVQANLTGLPAVSIPLWQHPNGLPFGLQVIGNKYKEAALLAFSKQLLDSKCDKN